MLKKTFVCFVCFPVFIFLSSCASTTVWDDTIPEDQLATIHFNRIDPSGYNGIPVRKWDNVKIPQGEAAFVADVNISYAGIMVLVHGMEFAYNFESGKEYSITGIAQNMQWGVKIYSGSDSTDYDFVPFKTQPVFR
ncbi:hypothetical protein LQZ19_12485 [Treponema primitia]|uniref:hypothetical protein n=1 Tax=Treponema primitia TaxID=88058 RepID=UPI00397F3688